MMTPPPPPFTHKIMGNSSPLDAQHSSLVVQLDCSHELYQDATFLWNWFHTSWLKFFASIDNTMVCLLLTTACWHKFFFLQTITLHPQTSFALRKCYAAWHLTLCRMTKDFPSLTCSPSHFLEAAWTIVLHCWLPACRLWSHSWIG